MTAPPDPDNPELDRSAELIEQLLSDPQLRARFRADPASVLYANGLTELADGLGTGPKALMTLELRESRSSLAGVMVAAAAEGVDVGHIAEHALPHLGSQAGRAVSRLASKLGRSTHHAAPTPKATPRPAAVAPVAPKPATPDLAPSSLPAMAHPAHHQAVVSEPVQRSTQVTEPTTTPEPVASTAGAEAVHHAAEAAAASDPTNLLQYPGNDATSRQIAAWMGANAQAAGLPPELPLMAALTESGLRNVDYGTADSVGFFQMRTSIWNEGPYAGFYSNPELQMKWFINEALSVKQSDPGLADSSSTWGDWVADIERPAAEYRYRYQLQLGNAQELLKNVSLSSYSSEATTSAATSVSGEAVRGAAAQTVVNQSAAETAATAVGRSEPLPAGLDGAAFVRATYARDGLHLPDTTAGQFDVGAAVPRNELRPGDAIFFGSAGGTPAKVGLYVGDGQVSMGSSGHLESLTALAKTGERYLGARRYTDKLLTGASSYARVMPTINE